MERGLSAAELAARVEKVAQSETLLLVQTKNVLAHPSCLLEVYAAFVAQLPIVSVNLVGHGCERYTALPPPAGPAPPGHSYHCAFPKPSPSLPLAFP